VDLAPVICTPQALDTIERKRMTKKIKHISGSGVYHTNGATEEKIEGVHGVCRFPRRRFFWTGVYG
jgi:hypothetical protein